MAASVTGSAQRAARQPFRSTLVFACAIGHRGTVTYTCDSTGTF
eukprot:COSAG01_NODE_27898_length_674_cov_0.944348_1_plen_43_part_10